MSDEHGIGLSEMSGEGIVSSQGGKKFQGGKIGHGTQEAIMIKDSLFGIVSCQMSEGIVCAPESGNFAEESGGVCSALDEETRSEARESCGGSTFDGKEFGETESERAKSHGNQGSKEPPTGRHSA